MPLGQRIPRAPTGIVVPRRQKELIRQVENLTRLQAAGGIIQTPGGPLIAQPGMQIRLGVTPDGGIPAKSDDGQTIKGVDVSDATLALTGTYSAKIQTWPSTFPGFNLSSQPVAGDTITIYSLLWGIWVCTWEDCPASGGD